MDHEVDRVAPYLHVLPQWRVVLCTVHQGCYTRQSLPRHLRDSHQLPVHDRKRVQGMILDSVAEHVTDVTHPPDGIPEIVGLRTVAGYLCHLAPCTFRSTSHDWIRQHYNHVHQWKVSHQGSMPWREAMCQTLFQERRVIQYFAVALVHGIPAGSNTTYISQSRQTVPSATWRVLETEYQQFQDQMQSSATTVGAALHPSEITPFMKNTGIHLHLAGLPLEELPDSYRLPQDPDDHPLPILCGSIHRILRGPMSMLVHDPNAETRPIGRHNARILNTFTRAAASQHPLEGLQNPKSQEQYIQLWQQMACYWYRTVEQPILNRRFQPTTAQMEAWEDLMRIIDRTQQNTADDSSSSGGDGHLALDIATRRWSLTIIQHSLSHRVFDSVLVSFAAVLFWRPRQRQWMVVGNYTSYLSQLIYDCQLIVLGHLRHQVEQDPSIPFTETLIQLRDQWLLNDTDGPVAELQANRLFGMKIGRSEVPPAQIRWQQDEQTLVYQDVVFHLADLHTIVWRSLQTAQTIFANELCLSGPTRPASEIPIFPIHRLVDNWDALAAGDSFLTDPRNQAELTPAQQWIFHRMGSSPVLMEALGRQSGSDPWEVDPSAADQYEQAVQHFLDALAVSFFIGSGQQARRPEFLGLRWRNTTLHPRDLFLHDGQILYILSYHKSQSRTNASRWPARFLLPEVGTLVVQFLALVQPFRQWLHRKTGNAHPVSDYLWSHRGHPWAADRLTDTMIRAGQRLLGKRIHIRAWRQITVGIAMKKFATFAPTFLETMPDDEELDEDGDPLGSMSAVFHFQAAHLPRTGNQMYGGTVNFRHGLTDAGLQEYRRASEAWHAIVRSPSGSDEQSPSLPPSTRPRDSSPLPTMALITQSTRRDREGSLPMLPPHESHENHLVKRIACRRSRVPSHRRRWTIQDAQHVLERMYGAGAQYRSVAQEQAIHHILDGVGQLVVILRTGEGKSLLFLLPCQLPGATTTVVILPLVVLRAEIEQRSLTAGIRAHIWDSSSHAEQAINCPLIVVGIEHATSLDFRSLLMRLQVQGRLDRVVFDECHLALTAAEYRKSISLLPLLRAVTCPFIFLTATLPPSLMHQFETTMLIRGSRLVRTATIRRDLTYEVHTCPPNQNLLEDFAPTWIQTALSQLDPLDRAIIYCRSREFARHLGHILQCPAYHAGSGSHEDKATLLKSWQQGEPAWMTATTAFGMGVDYPRVRLVVHVEDPLNMIDFAQETGRLGRDGRSGRSIVLLTPQWRPRTDPPHCRTRSEFGPMDLYLNQPPCRTAVLAHFLDGESRPCDSADPRCDQCQLAASVSIVSTSACEESSSVSSDASDQADLRIGAKLHQTHVRTAAEGWERYRRYLQILQGTCLICRLRPPVGFCPTPDHSLNTCTNPERRRYFEARTAALRWGQSRGGWIEKYACCYRCYNPQDLCAAQGRGHCDYPDLVMPACWAIYQRRDWVESVLETLGGAHVMDDEAAYMQWLGRRTTVYQYSASNAMRVANNVFGIICHDVLD